MARIFRSHFLEAAADALIQDSPDSPEWEDSRGLKDSHGQEDSRDRNGSQGQEDSKGRKNTPRHWFPQRALLTTAILSRCLRVIDSPDLINGKYVFTIKHRV